jgi:hypothetical protein
MMTLEHLTEIRREAVIRYQGWKTRSLTLTTMLADEWQTIWDDLSASWGEPLVENLALETITDRASTSAEAAPQIIVPGRKGTTRQRGEKSAEKRRRVYQSYLEYGDFARLRHRLFMDRLVHGAICAMPWTDLKDSDGRELRPAERHPYPVRIDPRTVYPLAFDSRGRMSAVFFTRTRSIKELMAEWGEDHPGVQEAVVQFRLAHGITKHFDFVEETWYFDDRTWAVAISARPIPNTYAFTQYNTRYDHRMDTLRIDTWLQPPIEHGLDRCPVVFRSRITFDGEFRSEIDAMLPRLKQAQNLMARYLDQLYDNVYGPVVIQGIINPEDYGPQAKLIGDGSGTARVEYPRPNSDFEVRQATMDQLEQARRQGFQPASRAGDPQSGWTTGRGQEKLLGGFSGQVAAAQDDVAHLLRHVLSLCAQWDEVHCTEDGVTKAVDVTEASLPAVEKYNPRSLFAGDWAVNVDYGPARGLDQQSLISTLGLADNMKLVPKKMLIERSGLVPDVLQAQRDMAMEAARDAMIALLFQQAQEGNDVPLHKFYEYMDDDTLTVDEAIMKVVEESRTQAAAGPGMPPGPEGAGPEGAMAMAADGQIDPSLLAGAGRDLAPMMPPGIQRNMPTRR